MTTRRDMLALVGGLLLGRGALAALGTQAQAFGTSIDVWKTPTCGCCHLWVQHLNANGFRATANDVTDVSPFRRKGRVPEALASCHTAFVGPYAVEGHVPADVIRQMLKQKPAILGIAAPGMPMGSPGMEGGRKDRYDIIAFDAAGKTRVFATR